MAAAPGTDANYASFTPVSLQYIKSLQNPVFNFTTYCTAVPVRFCETDFLTNSDSFKLKNGEPVYDVKSNNGNNECRISFYKKNIVNIHTDMQVHFYDDKLCFAKAEFDINHPSDLEMIKSQIARKYGITVESHLKHFVIADGLNNKIYFQLYGDAKMVYVSGSPFFKNIVDRFISKQYNPTRAIQDLRIQQSLS